MPSRLALVDTPTGDTYLLAYRSASGPWAARPDDRTRETLQSFIDRHVARDGTLAIELVREED